MNNNKKGLWIVLIVILVILIIWGIVSAYNHSEIQNGAQGGLTPATSTNTSSGASSNGNGAAASSNKNAPGITSLTPMIGKAGTIVTINGFGFTPSDNTVTFSGFALNTTARSADGVHLSLTIPDSLKVCNGGTCSTSTVTVQPGAYPITVINANGSSNVIYYTVNKANQ